MNNSIKDITIIGAGPVGLFAIFQAGMFNMSCNIIDIADHVGGQCTALYPEKYIYDIPAHCKITANNLIANLKNQSQRFAPEYYLSQSVVDLSFNDNVWTAHTSLGNKIHSKKIILATGAGLFKPKKPPLQNIDNFEESSIFYNITNIKNFHNKVVAIAGGGNSALDWTVAIAEIAKKTYLIHRKPNFRGNPATLSQIELLSKNKSIEIITPFQLHKLHGEDKQLTHITVKNFNNNEEKIIEIENLLLFFGLEANNSTISQWSHKPDMVDGSIVVNPATQSTNINGIFAIGDASTHKHKIKLILTGFAEAVTACHNIYIEIYNNKPNTTYSTACIKECT